MRRRVDGGAAYAHKSLTIVRPSDPVALDPHLETTAAGSWVDTQILEPLITVDRAIEIEGHQAAGARSRAPPSGNRWRYANPPPSAVP